jgi:eukaryotic-like serine/threonine-protein kinase
VDLDELNDMSRSVVLRPDARPEDYELALRQAQELCRLDPDCYQYLNTLGVALYRAGRHEEAIHRLEEAIQLRSGKSVPKHWYFLALAHHRLGHREEARRWLARFRNRQPSAFWAELEIRRLRSKAEALVLYDPIFPADSFAH